MNRQFSSHGQNWLMSALTQVFVHPSLFPENAQQDLLQSLRTRQIDHKFHYASYKQSAKWLALHESYSPARTDPDGAAIYDHSFAAAAKALNSPVISLVGVGCGGGQKEARLLKLLAGQRRERTYTPCDISLALVLTATRAAEQAEPGIRCFPLICDIGGADNLGEIFNANSTPRLLTFFGMIPNFEPELIMPRLADLIRPGDLLLFSANLAPGSDYAAGVLKILPGYDNAQTRDWLATFLYDLGVEREDGSIQFSIEDVQGELQRIVAHFCFSKARSLTVHGERFEFQQGEKIRLFFSYRYTPDRVAALLSKYGLSILDQWVTISGEEGVFLCARAGR